MKEVVSEIGPMRKRFSIAGPINPEYHYCVSERLDENVIRDLIDGKEYFMIHAPRQSGKTTTMQMLVDKLNSEGIYKVLYMSVQAAKAIHNDIEKGMLTILKVLRPIIKGSPRTSLKWG